MATPRATNQAGPVCPRLNSSSSIRTGTAGARRHRAPEPPPCVPHRPGNRNISLHFSVRFSFWPTGKPEPFTSPAFPSPSPVVASLPRTERGSSSESIRPSSHGNKADAEVCGLVRRRRRRRPAGRRLRARRAGRARPHLSLRLHRRLRRHGRRIWCEGRRGHADGCAGGGGDHERARGGGAGDGGVPRLRRTPEPGGDGGDDGAGPPLQAPDRAVRRRAAAGILPRLHPPPLPHRRHGDPGARPGRGHPADAGPGDGGDPHLLPPVRHLRHDPGPAEPGPHHRPAADGAHRRRQQPRRRQLHRRVHEPGPVLRAGPGHRGLDPPLGLLARPAAGWVPRRGRLRVTVRGQQDARAAAQWGLLTIRPGNGLTYMIYIDIILAKVIREGCCKIVPVWNLLDVQIVDGLLRAVFFVSFFLHVKGFFFKRALSNELLRLLLVSHVKKICTINLLDARDFSS